MVGVMMAVESSKYGNYLSYLRYTLPTAKQLFGELSFRKKSLRRHQEKVQQMLESLAVNGSMTTWELAKAQRCYDAASVRAMDKDFRRLLVGRRERGKASPGLVDIGLVLVEQKIENGNTLNSYRLSIHGILYCITTLELTEHEIDVMALKYSNVLPMLFGKWEYLKSIIGSNVYNLQILASGVALDNIRTTSISEIPIFEMYNYLNAKYQNYYESISENDLADQISFWFFTHNLTMYLLNDGKKGLQTWKKIFQNDDELSTWFSSFLDETITFYQKRLDSASKLKF